MTYYDTTNAGEMRAHYEKLANTQEGEILSFFKRHHHKEMSPSYIWRTLFPNLPVTSVRRAMTNLANAGCLEKTPNKVEGYYGRPEHKWKYLKEITPENSVQMRLEL